MNKKQKRLVRIVAVVLAALLVFSAVISAVISIAYGEEALSPAAYHCELTMEYLNEEQALRTSQRLVYTNETGRRLDRVVFYVPANLLRRQSALFYEQETLKNAFPDGYLPGGIELLGVNVNESEADWGFQGVDEAYLRVACNLEPGESCAFRFDYFLLLTRNAAFLGISDGECRLSDFYFIPASTDSAGEFILNKPMSYTRWIDAPAMDFAVNIVLPEGLNVAATGEEQRTQLDGGLCRWEINSKNTHDFALLICEDLKEEAVETPSGVSLRCLTDVRGGSAEVLQILDETVQICEEWFGPLPFRQLDVVQANHAPGPLKHTGCLWLSRDAIKAGGQALAHQIRAFVAQQYFGRSAYARVGSDAWLSDSVCEYIAYLILEEAQGHEAYLSALNEDLVDALQLTIPGGLTVTSDAYLFTEYEYDVVVLKRGAAVFHELRTAMGREDLIRALRLFYEKGSTRSVLGEMDLVDALDAADGGSWEKFLTDWLFNIGDYVNQEIFWLD